MSEQKEAAEALINTILPVEGEQQLPTPEEIVDFEEQLKIVTQDTEPDLDDIEKQLEELEFELAKTLLDKCPKCGSDTFAHNGDIFCPGCTRASIAKRSLENSLVKIRQMREVYRYSIVRRRKPTATPGHLQTLVPECLLHVNMHEEFQRIACKESALSSKEREFVVRYVELEVLYKHAIKHGLTKEELAILDKEKADKKAAEIAASTPVPEEVVDPLPCNPTTPEWLKGTVEPEAPKALLDDE
jgi:uncharacterized Zn finger protein (UPF0148 family)